MDNVFIKNLPNSEVEITAEIRAGTFDSYRKKAIAELGKEVELPGFRKGHVPESILEQKLGEDAILHEMAELGIAESYPKLILEKNIEAIGRPNIVITKIAAGNPLGFKITTAVLPALELPDYKTVAKNIMGKVDSMPEVTEKDIDDTIETIRKNWAQTKTVQNKKEDAEIPVGSALPDINDEFAQKVGDFKTVADLRVKIKEDLTEERKISVREKKRIETMDKILEKTKTEAPLILIENEKNKMMFQFKDNIVKMGLKPEKYFEQVKKTEDEVKKEWTSEATKRVKIQFVLGKIAELENIKVPEEELSKEVTHLIEHYSGADPDRARGYAEEILRNGLVWKFLEEQR